MGKSMENLEKDQITILGDSMDELSFSSYTYEEPKKEVITFGEKENKKSNEYEEMAQSVVDLLEDNDQGDKMTKEEIKELLEQAKVIDDSYEELYDGRSAEDVISVEAKAKRLELQISVIERQENGEVLDKDAEEFKYVIVKNSHDRLAKDILNKEKLKENIQMIYDSIHMKHLEDNLKIPPFAIDHSKIVSTIQKTYKKIYSKDNSGFKSATLDISKLLFTLDRLNNSPAAKPINRKFVYGLCKYIDKYHVERFTYIENLVSNINYLTDQPKLKQNTQIIYTLERIFLNKF